MTIPLRKQKKSFVQMLRDNQLNDKEVEIAIDQKSNPFQSLDIPGMPGAQMGMLNMNDIFGKGLKNKKKTKLKIGEAYEPLIQEERKIAENKMLFRMPLKAFKKVALFLLMKLTKSPLTVNDVAVTSHVKVCKETYCP